jgi:ubiquinone/menaquinone biosynthesis C-methylase UbiE
VAVGYRQLCHRFYWRAQQVLAPRLLHAQTVYTQALGARARQSPRWLDLGCGRELVRWGTAEAERALAAQAQLLVGLDRDLPSLRAHRAITRRVHADGAQLPFAPESFDLVTANMVLEHLADPASQLRECWRALKPGGALLLHTPNAAGYPTLLAKLVPAWAKSGAIWLLEGRGAADVFPTFHRINSERAVRQAARQAGFQAESVRLVASGAQFIVIPPLAVLELLFIRLLLTRLGRPWRTNIIAVVRKPARGAVLPGQAA